MAASKAKRSAAAKKAARTRKLNAFSQNMFAKDFDKLTKKREIERVKKESKKGGVKKSARKKTKRISFLCPGTELTRRKDGKWNECTEKHDVGSFYAAQKIAMSEGLWRKKLEREIGKNGIVFRTGTAVGVFDIGTYKKNKKLDFYEIKPKIPRTNVDRLLKPEQKDWAVDKAWKLHITTKLVYYDEKNFVFYHSKPILLTKKNIEQYSKPNQLKKAKEIQKIPCTKLFSDKRAEKYCKELTGHSVKIIRRIDRLRRS